ncbi:SAM-dependent methyltransferase [Catenuloplanes nepalensis]|uniref:SAM-dependent methyltransferase n=1 Tax=Catenuloplanes nepalensis TaxID=587533 RepID=A0ABT9MX47_9ACTN|nr:class I SAM-dependent methyltransferase [Catenuloplanes nepalensis]MDP9796025.1 SAM-dependent methyltransferase [Catenuloplanes nepalensis]
MTEHHHHDDSSMAELLELDGAVLAGYLDTVTAWVAGLAADPPKRIVDLGAGTGIGTLALAARFPGAEVVAVDNSPRMLERIRAAAARDGLGGRIATLEADLAGGWPGVERPGLVWAALSMHHVPDPEALLGQIRDALPGDGLLVVSEMPGQPRFLGDDPWEQRLHEAIAERQMGFDPHPDWTATMERLGYRVTRRDFPIEVSEPADLVRRYFLAFLRRMRGAVAERLTAGDLRILDEIVASDAAGRAPAVRTSRTVWAARR